MLLSIKPTVGEWKLGYKKSQEEGVILDYLCVNPARHAFFLILKQEEQLQCMTYQTPRTVKHYFTECRAFAIIRKCFFNARNMKGIFVVGSIQGGRFGFFV